MRIGISSTLVKDRDVSSLIPLLGERRFLYLEVRCKKGHFDYENLDEIKKLKSSLKRAGVMPLALHPPDWVDVGSKNEWDRMKSVREVEKCILVAEKLHSERVILHPSNSQTEMDIVKKSLEEIIGFEREWGIEVILENPFPPKTGSILEEIKSLAEEFGTGICLDTSHLFSNGYECYDSIEDISHLIKEVHASDSLFNNTDDHLLPGEGKIDWGRFFNTIEREKLDVIIELMPARYPGLRIKQIEEVMSRWLSGFF